MKAKSIVLSVALAALGLLAMRQNASAIAGVYYVAMTNGYNFVANQLIATDASGATNNTLTNVVIAPPEGTRAYTYNVTNQAFLPPAIYHTNGGWTTNFDCSPGKGFVIYANSQWSNTFVGQVPTGYLTNFVRGSNAFSLIAAEIPLNGRLIADLNFPGTDGDDLFLFRTIPQVYSDAITFFTNYTWFDPQGPPGPADPTVKLGESFFLQNPGPGTNWVIFFDPLGGPVANPKAVTTADSPSIGHLRVSLGKATLDVLNPGGGGYNVQFSSDATSWKTVATNQTATVWTGTYAGTARGYYQVVRP